MQSSFLRGNFLGLLAGRTRRLKEEKSYFEKESTTEPQKRPLPKFPPINPPLIFFKKKKTPPLPAPPPSPKKNPTPKAQLIQSEKNGFPW